MKHLLALTLIAACTGASAANLITNGSFENLSGATCVTSCAGFNGSTLSGGNWSVFSALPGWTTASGPGIEVRNNVAGVAQEGSNFVELDSHGAANNSNNSWMQQVFNSPSAALSVSFWYAARPGTGPATNGLQVWLNGTDIGGLLTPGNPGAGTNNTTWTLYSANVTGLVGSNTLKFGAVGTQDTLGGSLDNVSVSAVPEPSGYALVIAGLATAGLFARRRKN